MKTIIATMLILVCLSGCATKSVNEQPKQNDITAESVSKFAVGMGIGLLLWSIGGPDLNGEFAPDFDLGE